MNKNTFLNRLKKALGSLSAQEKERTAVTYEASGAFSAIELKLKEADLTVLPSENGKCCAVCLEDGQVTFSLGIEGETLKLTERDARKWNDRIGIHFGGRSVKLYLPAGEYAALTVQSASGRVECTESVFSFGDVSLSTASGRIKFATPAQGTLTAVSASGSISLEGAELRALTAVSASGRIHLDGVKASEKIELRTASGGIRFENCDAAELALKSSSGSICGTLLSDKIFDAKSGSGTVRVPVSVKDGGICVIKTGSGNINVTVAEKQ